MIYADAGGSPGSLVAVSNEVSVAHGQAAGWVDFGFASPPTLAAGNYWLGFIEGGSASVIRIYWDAAANGTEIYNSDTYSDGPSSPFGSPRLSTAAVSVYATYTTP